MSNLDELTRYLGSRSPDQLARILSLRPDVGRGPQVTSLRELAGRLSTDDSLYLALEHVPEPCIQLIHGLVGLGPATPRSVLLDLVAFEDPAAPDLTEFADALGRLSELAVLWPGPEDRWHHDPALDAVVGRPMGLGIPVRVALAQQPRQRLVDLSVAWHLPTKGSNAQLLDRLVTTITDQRRVRAAIDAAPASAAEYLETLAAFQVGEGPPPRHNGGRAIPGEEWAVRRGLLTAGSYYVAELPVEVLLAIRQDRVRLRFTARPPELRARTVDPAMRRSGAAAAAADITGSAAALIDRLERHPAQGLKVDGIGSRELAKVGKALGIDETRVRIDLELLHANGFLAPSGSRVGIAPAAANWRANEPARRYAELVATWFTLAIHPSIGRDADGKVIPAAQFAAFGSAQVLRGALLTLFEEIGDTGAVDNPSALARLVRWYRPIFRCTPAEIEAVWLEAHALGVLVDGAVSEVGRCLLDGDPQALRDLSARLLPPATSTGRFGSDLTVMVAGSPAAQTSRLLDGCADREGRGAAVVWRFSPASVRRAFDEGWTADELTAALTAIADSGTSGAKPTARPGADPAGSGLPQTLTYLIADVARRHGHLVVLPAGCCLRAADPALLREVVSHRSLAALRPHAVSDTVAVFQQAPDAVVQALRAAGYLPVPADPHGVVDLRRGSGRNGAPAGSTDSPPVVTDGPAGSSSGRRGRAARGPLDRLSPTRPSPEAELAGLTGALDLATTLLKASAADPDGGG